MINPTAEKQIFEIVVWYRYVIAGEQEKEYNIHNVEAFTVQEAINISETFYKSHSAIPFHFSCEGVRYEPQTLTKNDLYNLTNPN